MSKTALVATLALSAIFGVVADKIVPVTEIYDHVFNSDFVQSTMSNTTPEDRPHEWARMELPRQETPPITETSFKLPAYVQE